MVPLKDEQNKPPARLTEKKRERTQVNWKWKKRYYRQHTGTHQNTPLRTATPQLGNPEEKGKSPETKSCETKAWRNRKSEQINHWKGEWISNQRPPNKLKSRTRWLHGWVPRDIENNLYQCFQKTEEVGTLPKAFYNATITLIPKLDKEPPKQIHTGQYIWWI